MSSEETVLVGGGGHCRAIIDLLEAAEIPIAGILDPGLYPETKVLGYPVLGGDNRIPDYVSNCRFLITVGQIKSAETRKRIFADLVQAGAKWLSPVSPTARVSSHAEIGSGTAVMFGAYVGPAARLGSNCIVNNGALVEHDVIIGDHCHVSTSAVINGGAWIGNETFIGSNAMIREGVRIGERVLIPAGASIMKDVPSETIVRS